MLHKLFVTLCLIAATATFAIADDAKDRNAYRIGAGDRLEIAVWKNEQLSRTVTVRPDGKISLPLVNDVEAAGVTPMELRDFLAKKFAEYVPSAEVSVIVSEFQSFRVSVIGAVKNSGEFQLRGPTTVLEALAKAGGLTEFASRKSISVLRNDGGAGSRRLPFNYDRAIDSDDKSEANFTLRAGDVVVVP